jgi:hypothetical protein
MRDAALRNDLPSIKKLTTDPRYFPYRYGQALWAYIGGRWGDRAVPALFRASLRVGWEQAVRGLLGMSSDTLSAQWLASIRQTYMPAMEGRQRPGEVGTRLLERQSETGDMDVSPAISPDGRLIAFLSRRGLFTIDLYIADASTGRIVKRLTSPNRDPHFDALSFISSAGSWSPDGTQLAFVVFAEGDNEIAIFDVASGRVQRRIAVREVGEISNPAWGPNGQIAFSGSRGGISDLYILDLASGRARQLTSDRFADLQPAWSPDGRTIAFASDRGPETDFERLTYDELRLTTLDVESGRILTLPGFDGAKHINPQWSPDGRDLYFISDRDGFSDLYRRSMEDGQVHQVTRLATGISGISASSPAMSVAARSGRIAFSLFENSGNSLFTLEPENARGEAVPVAPSQLTLAAMLPPVETTPGLVTAYLNDPSLGLPPADTQYRVLGYRPSLSLDYLGSPGVGVAVGPGGPGVGGGVIGYFGDMLGDRVLGAAVIANGGLKDIGGQLFYINQRRRWNWLVGGGHTPYLSGGVIIKDSSIGPTPVVLVDRVLQRVYVDEASGGLQYPLSQIRRFELGAAATRVNYEWEVERLIADPFTGQVYDQDRFEMEAPPSVAYFQGSAAFVGDYSYFGFTSPIAGGRYRFEVTPTFGDVTFQGALADYRRYFFFRPVTFAFRALGYGRFGEDAESGALSPLFVGEEPLIRGYAAESFDATECTRVGSSNACPEFDRLIGSRIGVANIELRLPLFGTDELGLIDFPFLPTELAPFVDAGVAWTSDESPTFEFSRESVDRIPVVSAGIAARFNLFGYFVFETYWAYPYQRPRRGGHFGFQLQPGW